MGKPLPLPFYKHNHLNGFHNASDLVSPHFRPLDVIFHPCGRKIAQLATGTDKSGKLMRFSIPIPTLFHQMELPNDIIIQTKLTLTLTLTLTLNPNPTIP